MKEKIKNLMKRRGIKVIIALLIVFMLINIVEIIVTSQTASRNKEWGLKLTVSNVSSTGLTMTIERNDSERTEVLSVGSSYWVEKRTIFGWTPLEFIEGGSMSPSLMTDDIMKDGNSRSFKKNWERAFGKLEPGVYRIRTDAYIIGKWKPSAEELIKNPELKDKIEKDPVLYATFVVLF